MEPGGTGGARRRGWSRLDGRAGSDQFDQPQDKQEQQDEHDDKDGTGLSPEHEDQRREGHGRYAERPAMRIRPYADRASLHTRVLELPPQPGQTGRGGTAQLDRGDRGPGQERGGGDDQAQDQDRAQRFLDEPDERIEQSGRRVGGKHVARHTVQVDAAEDQQPGCQHQHR